MEQICTIKQASRKVVDHIINNGVEKFEIDLDVYKKVKSMEGVCELRRSIKKQLQFLREIMKVSCAYEKDFLNDVIDEFDYLEVALK